MLDPGDCGPAFIGLCQDTQELAFDYPEVFFTPTVHAIPRPRPDRDRVAKAIEMIKNAKAAAHHLRRRCALFGSREGGFRLRAEARHPDGGDDCRKGRRDA